MNELGLPKFGEDEKLPCGHSLLSLKYTCGDCAEAEQDVIRLAWKIKSMMDSGNGDDIAFSETRDQLDDALAKLKKRLDK